VSLLQPGRVATLVPSKEVGQ